MLDVIMNKSKSKAIKPFMNLVGTLVWKSGLAAAFLLASPAAFGQMKTPPTQSGPAVIPGEHVTVDRFGLTPNKLTRGQGIFVLEFENRLLHAAETYSISLDADSATVFASTQTSDTVHRGSVFLNLEPGTYRVTLANHPELRLRFVITN
jgi:hypothetical protein